MGQDLLFTQVGGIFLGGGKHLGALKPATPKAVEHHDERCVKVLAIVDKTLVHVEAAKAVKDETAEEQLDSCCGEFVLRSKVVVDGAHAHMAHLRQRADGKRREALRIGDAICLF